MQRERASAPSILLFKQLDIPAGICYDICLSRGVIYMNPERHVKLFKNGRNQAVRIPREFELPGEDAVMRKEGERLVIEPVVPQSLLALLAILRPLDEDFDTIEELPLEQVDL